MEAKFLASALSFLSIFLAIYAQSLANDIDGTGTGADDSSASATSTEFEIEPAIYYGDSIVNLGEPFSITCIIPITEQIHWLKNGEPITRHNLRHGRDEHAYTLAESAIEGEKHKIEAHLSVRHALKVHEGRYQCNQQHSSYHTLHVRNTPGGPTESVYQTVDELTPTSAMDELFTRTWREQQQTGQLGQSGQRTPTASNSHHAHKQHKQPTHLLYGNASGHEFGQPRGEVHRVYSATPPDFPPPRINMLEHTLAPPEPPTIQLYNQTVSSPVLPHHHTVSSSSSATDVTTASTTSQKALLATAHHHSHRQQQLQQQAQHTLNSFQLPVPPAQQGAPPYQPATPNERYQTYAPQFVPSTSTATAASSLNPNYIGLMQQQPKTFLPVKKGPDSLVPNYDNEEHKMKFYDIRTPLVLSCNVQGVDSTEPLIWEKNGTEVSKLDSLRGRYKILDAERKFIIDRAEAYDDGLYTCVFNGVRKDINAIARVVVRVPSNSGFVEGEKMWVVCTVAGTAPKLSWNFGNLTLTNSTGRYILKSDDSKIENSVLMIENITLDDRGEYKCIGRNAANDYGNSTFASDAITVRVKGKFAALWPFLGICAEVLILCLIILIYEKRRNKSELEESDTDPQEQKKKRRNYD